MKIERTIFKDLLIIENKIHYDSRGDFSEIYREDILNDFIDHKVNFTQTNLVRSNKNSIRGLHFQHPPFSQAKLITAIDGQIIDVAVDLGKDSKTYKQYFKFELNSNNNKSIFIPRGFAHGYLTLSESATILYHVDNLYSQQHEDGIKYDSKELNIDWGVKNDLLIVSEKDKKLSFEF